MIARQITRVKSSVPRENPPSRVAFQPPRSRRTGFHEALFTASFSASTKRRPDRLRSRYRRWKSARPTLLAILAPYEQGGLKCWSSSAAGVNWASSALVLAVNDRRAWPSSKAGNFRGSLRSDQVRRLLRVITEAHELSPYRGERASHVVSGLRKILGAVVGGCLIDRDFRPKGRGAFTVVALEGWDPSTLPVLQVLGREGNAFNPGIRALMRVCPPRAAATITATRRQLVDDRDWYGSPYVENYVRVAHLDHALYSSKRDRAPGVVHGLGFYRASNDRPFDEEDRNLLHLFHLECEDMLGDSGAADADCATPVLLPPRERQTLDLLLAGLADKEIAARLGISPHTVNHYTKSIYRRFGVNSRMALLAGHSARRRTTAAASLVSGTLIPAK